MLWLNPTYLWALAAVPVAVALFLWAAWQRRRAARQFGDPDLVGRLAAGVSARRRRWKAAVVVFSVLLLALALAGPRFGTKLREVKREGVDIVIALDVSQSMLAEDVAPNRLLRAKNEIGKLLDELRGDRVGLVLFSGDAFIQSPLTTDYSAVRLFLDIAGPSLIPTPGTNFRAAVQSSIKAFELREESESGAEQRTRVLLIVSDGENHVGDLEDIIEEAREANLTVFTAGVGETAGAPIPVTANGITSYKRDQDGQIVSTRLEEAALQELAAGGAYYRIGRTTSSLSEIIPALERLERTEFEAERFEEYEEQYQWPLALALLLLILERTISERRRKTVVVSETKTSEVVR